MRHVIESVIARILTSMATSTVHATAEQDHQHVVMSDMPTIVRDLDALLGSRLVAYIGGVKETRAVRQWSTGERVPVGTTERRLRTALQTAKALQYREAPSVIQAWFQGMNPRLDDRSPARVLREADIDAEGPLVLSAARVFAQHG